MGKKYKNDGWMDSITGKNADLEKRYGVDPVRFSRSDDPNWAEDVENRNNYTERMTEGFRKDYDARETLQAAANSGKKEAQEILDSGFKSVGDIRNAQNFFEKAAKRHGQGGQFSNASDYMGLTQSMVERDRKKEAQRFSDEYVAKTELDDIRRDIEENARNAEAVVAPELSEELGEANRGIDQYSLELNTHGDNIFGSAGGSDLETAMAENERNPASGESWEYKDKYASNVKQGIKLSGINTRGPDSIVAAKEVLRRTV